MDSFYRKKEDQDKVTAWENATLLPSRFSEKNVTRSRAREWRLLSRWPGEPG
jgi:hypothetical protein